jgi:SAM-dependent methyltransferase
MADGGGGGLRVNVGCGATPTVGWINLDNSLSVRAARWPAVMRLLKRAGLLTGQSWDLARLASRHGIRFADAAVRIPCADDSVEVVYSSHMIEHLDRGRAHAFLAEARRVLRPGGLIRLAAPDLWLLARDYSATGDADEFVAGTRMCAAPPAGLVPRLRSELVGPRQHLWMYDGRSLSKLVREAGFCDVSVMAPGRTNIADPGSLDLEERAEESVYVEAVKPG